MTGNDLAARVEQLVTPTIEAMGFDIVRVLVTTGQHATLQIMAEPSDGRLMVVDDCADISRAVSAIMDVEDPIPDAYTLEVSSPGLDRPLVRLRDFERFAGFEAKIELFKLTDGRRRFKSRIVGVEENVVVVDVEGEQIRLDHSDIAKAKLIVTDEMLAKLEDVKAS